MEDPLSAVRRSTKVVSDQAKHVKISQEGISRLLSSELQEKSVKAFLKEQTSDFEEVHLVSNEEITIQYLLVVDAINFCFWPDGELEYEHIAGNTKRAVIEDPACISAENLLRMEGETLRQLIDWPRELPQEGERARVLREVGSALLAHYDGLAVNLVKAANCSASSLVDLITRSLPAFRDHAIYRGEQVFFYKRAQIFVGDVFQAFKGQGLGSFHDIDKLTMFADYRVPITLQELDIIHYSEELQKKVDNKEVLEPGSPFEVEIRACTVQAVEMIIDQMKATYLCIDNLPMSIELDWWLWHKGEARRSISAPHHRVKSIYY